MLASTADCNKFLRLQEKQRSFSHNIFITNKLSGLALTLRLSCEYKNLYKDTDSL